jgi:hypothetical protein
MHRALTDRMLDLLFMAIAVIFFGVGLAYVSACDRL